MALFPLDNIEESEGKLSGYEIKYNLKEVKAPHSWLNTYKNSYFDFVNKSNYTDFIS